MNEKITYTGELYLTPYLKISYIEQKLSKMGGRLDDFIETYGFDPSLYKSILRKLGLEKSCLKKE